MNVSQALLTFEGLGLHFELFGIKMHISVMSFLLVVLLMMQARMYIARQMRQRPASAHLPMALGAALSVMGSLGLHELSHGVVGALLGHTTTDAGFTALGAYVKVSPTLSYASPAGEILIAMSGALMNFVLAAIGYRLVVRFGESRFENALQFVTLINYELGVFNLFPILGLDGSKVLHGLLRSVVADDTAALITLFLTIPTVYLLMRRIKRGPSWFAQALEEA